MPSPSSSPPTTASLAARAVAFSASLPRYQSVFVNTEEKLEELRQRAPSLAFDSKDAKELAVRAITHSSLSATRNNTELVRVGQACGKAVAAKALFLSAGVHIGEQYNKAIAINFSVKVLAPIARQIKLQEVLRTASNTPSMSDEMLAKALLALLGALELVSGDEAPLRVLKELEIVKLPKSLQEELSNTST
ncbi:ribonuclease III [Rhodotorula toruloides]|uniref:Ribonuclease III n=1 Tax=Rhodotorula toruloides TaxID=5286 RepID=A0A511KGV7_RHOTO|nr:ribonuclease III [Rhodotorula toruloides]